MKDNDLVLMHRDQRNRLLKLKEFVKAKICEFNHHTLIIEAISFYNKGRTWDEWMVFYEENKAELIKQQIHKDQQFDQTIKDRYKRQKLD